MLQRTAGIGRRFWGVILSLVLLINYAGFVPAAAAYTDTLQNPGFETGSGTGPGTFSPWWLDVKSGASATLSADTATHQAGAQAARIDIAAGNGNDWGVQLYHHVALTAGTAYTASFWARAGTGRPVTFALQSSTSPYTTYYSAPASLTPGWQRYSFTYTPGASDADALFLFNLGAATGPVWLDTVALDKPTPALGYFRGVNLNGGDQSLCCGADVFAPPATLDYFQSKGLNTFRVTIAWVRLQPTLYGPLDATYLGKMDTLVANAKARGQKVSFVPMDRNYDVGGSIPTAAFVDLWKKIAAHYKDETAIWGYDLLNEPNMGDAWNTTIAPQAIAAIRTIDMAHPIVMPTSTGGYGHNWNYHLAGLPVNDPANNVIYQAHFYFDTPANGQYPNGTTFDVPGGDLNIGVERATDFVNWCKANNQRCYAGEYGIPGGWSDGNATCTNGPNTTDARWLTVLDNFLTYLDGNGISGTYWAGGPYGDVNDLGPTCSGVDRPQMAVLTRHLGSGVTAPTPTPKPAYYVYADSLSSAWQDWSWGSTVALTNASPTYAGSSSLRFQPDSGWAALRLHASPGPDTTGYATLRFAVQAAASGGTYDVWLYDPSGNQLAAAVPLSSYGGAPVAGSWKTYAIPLTDLNGANRVIGDIVVRSASPSSQPALYLDELRLAP
jgi:hypothetical protein